MLEAPARLETDHETDGVFSDAGELDNGFRAPYVRLRTGRALLLLQFA